MDLVKIPEHSEPNLGSRPSLKATGPAFRQVYHKLFGPTFPGEYLPPGTEAPSSMGTYILSYPGLTFSFSLQPSAWSVSGDFVSLLSSSAASSARSLTIFNGSSWQDARQDLFTRPCQHPRSLALTGRGREGGPEELELIKIRGSGRLDLLRKSGVAFRLTLGETTPQDLVAELGPPDAIYRKSDRRLSIHKTRGRSRSDQQTHYSSSPGRLDGFSDTDRSSAITSADDSDSEEAPTAPTGKSGEQSSECFYNYFHHGFDVFVSYPSGPSPGLGPANMKDNGLVRELNASQLVATKILLHANVPGSYPFNRYRRSRWVIETDQTTESGLTLSSESSFSALSKALQDIWKSSYTIADEEKLLQRGMVLNRGWGDSPGSSCELLGGWEESADTTKRGQPSSNAERGPSLGNTELFGFPGLLFEVLKNDTVSCVTVY